MKPRKRFWLTLSCVFLLGLGLFHLESYRAMRTIRELRQMTGRVDIDRLRRLYTDRFTLQGEVYENTPETFERLLSRDEPCKEANVVEDTSGIVLCLDKYDPFTRYVISSPGLGGSIIRMRWGFPHWKIDYAEGFD